MLTRRGLLLSGAGVAQAAPSRRLRLVNDVYPPYVMPAGEALGDGIDVELLREALAPAGYTLELQLLPWRRALAMLEQGEADLTTTVSLSADRDAYLHYSVGYRRQVLYSFFALKERKLELRSLAQLSGYRLGLAAGFRYPPAIEAAAIGRVDRGRDLPTLVNMLAAQRVDVICGNHLPLAWSIRQQGLAKELQRQPYAYRSRSSTYMAVAKRRHPASGGLLASVDAGLQRLQATGRAAAIERRYLQALGSLA